MSGHYNEIAICPVCDQIVEPTSHSYKFALVIGTACQLFDTRPQEPQLQPSGAASDEPKLVLVHEDHADEFARRVSANIWPPSDQITTSSCLALTARLTSTLTPRRPGPKRDETGSGASSSYSI
jgi:hypothetical protein